MPKVQSGKTTAHSQELVEKSLNPHSFLVHRLDRATSGLMIIAHTKITARNLSGMLAKRQIKKTYVAIVKGKFSNSAITLDEKIDKKDALKFYNFSGA
ncbi:pseudouridine synthase [Abyssogena phaseoliformis symbiont]|uniref:pseudouridine synthase n=1 Tax=Abyssogena phaseoliformis symbiont TaxID=596095 RepID=UPI0019168861|nr:pseudouridine synthase [Abyssogena phaseoliformis symbiont]